MPKCKYKNYCIFLAPLFEVVTTKDNFYETNEIHYICRAQSHHNRLGVGSFGNKKSKVEIQDFCQGCKDDSEISKQTSDFTKRVLESCGHIILEVNFSSRKVRYQCGNCDSINCSFVQNFNEDATSFCGKCQNDKYKILFGKLKKMVESHGFTLLTKKDEYQNNKQKLKLLCACGKPHQSVLSDIVRDKHCYDCKLKKYEATCMERYGVRNVSQDPEIFEKIVKNSYTGKKYEFPSGKVVRIQGYEGYAIGDLLNENVEENDLFFGKDIPTFHYLDDDQVHHVYHPDIFVKSLNMIVEVKSDYTYRKELRKNYLKFRNVIKNKNGYILRVMIYNDKVEIVKDITVREMSQIEENFLSDIEAFRDLLSINL